MKDNFAKKTDRSRPPRFFAGGILAGLLVAFVLVFGGGTMASFGMGHWFLLGLIPGAPALKVVTDILMGHLAPTPNGMSVTYLSTLYKIVCLLVAQAIYIVGGFLAFPVGFFLLFFHVLIGFSWIFGEIRPEQAFMLCKWLDLKESYCLASVLGFHTIQLSVVYLTFKYGSRLFDILLRWYSMGVARIESMRISGP